MAASSTSLMALSITAAAAITAHRFTTLAGAVPGAGAGAVGVARAPAASGEMLPIDVIGTAVVETGGAVVAGALVETDNQGRAITRSTGIALGRALAASGGAGEFVEVMLGMV